MGSERAEGGDRVEKGEGRLDLGLKFLVPPVL